MVVVLIGIFRNEADESLINIKTCVAVKAELNSSRFLLPYSVASGSENCLSVLKMLSIPL